MKQVNKQNTRSKSKMILFYLVSLFLCGPIGLYSLQKSKIKNKYFYVFMNTIFLISSLGYVGLVYISFKDAMAWTLITFSITFLISYLFYRLYIGSDSVRKQIALIKKKSTAEKQNLSSKSSIFSLLKKVFDRLLTLLTYTYGYLIIAIIKKKSTVEKQNLSSKSSIFGLFKKVFDRLLTLLTYIFGYLIYAPLYFIWRLFKQKLDNSRSSVRAYNYLGTGEIYTFDYKGANDYMYKERNVVVNDIYEKNGYTYVDAYDTDINGNRCFRTDRIL